MRLAKFLASSGVASRRSAESLIKDRRISVDGKIITDPATGVGDESVVLYDGKKVKPPLPEQLVYVMFNKPPGVLSTMSPGRESGDCLADYVKTPDRIFPVGRLDMDSSGLILMTNDGELTFALTHPSKKIKKEYLVKLNKPLKLVDFRKIHKNIWIEGRPVEIDSFEPAPGGRFRIIIHEGRKRIIRRLFREMRYSTVELKRVRLGSLSLGRLAIGKWRYLKKNEIDNLRDLVNFQKAGK